MPPLHDNIVDALALIQDGASHVLDLDNTGATMETNESTFNEGIPSLWLKIDLSAPEYAIIYGNAVPITFSSVPDGGSPILPYLDLWRPNDPTFDPAAPDFSKLVTGGSSNFFVGNGSASPPPNSNTINPADSATGIFYMFVGDWFGTNFGGQTITYTIPLPPVITDVDTSDWNMASGSVSSLGGGVIKETQLNTYSFASDRRGVIDQVWTFKASGAQLPPNGRYQLYLLGKFNGTWSGETDFFVSIRRNGELLLPYARLRWAGTSGTLSAKNTWELFDVGERHTFPSPTWFDGPGPTTVPVVAGDIFEFAIYRAVGTTSWAEISGMRFVQVEAGGGNASAINLASMPRTAVDSNADGRDDPTNESTIHCKDFCILDNGDVYVGYVAQSSGLTDKWNIKLIKFSGGVWSTVSTDLSHASNGPNFTPTGTQPSPYGQIALDTDGTDVYIAWGEADNTFSKLLTFPNGTSTGRFYAMKWHVKKYVPGTGFTELGTGQNAIPLSARTKAASSQNGIAPDCAWFSTSIQIKLSPLGVPFVATAETQDAFYGGGTPPTATFEKPYVYYWDGASWIDTLLPDPPNIDLVTSSEGVYVDFIKVDPQRQIDLTFCHHDGPNNNPSIVYSLGSFDTGRGHVNQRFIYQEYNGSSWGNLINQISYEIWPGGTLSQIDFPAFTGGHGQQGMSLDNDGHVPIFAAALWNSHYADFIKVAKVKSDGSALEPFYPELSGADIIFRDDRPGERDGGGWFDPTGCAMAIDGSGRPWVIFDGVNRPDVEFGTIVSTVTEPGTANYWILGSRQNGIAYGVDPTGFSRIKIKGSNLYILGFFQIPPSSDALSIVVAPINDPYSPWTNVVSTSILAYYKDGAWHQANSEASRDLYYYKSGTWHKKDNGLQAHKNAMWQA